MEPETYILPPMESSEEEFDQFVREAIDSIDPQFRRYLDEVPVIVEDLPDESTVQRLNLPDRYSLLGLFHGVPLNRRSVHGISGPNQIVLYRQNLLSVARSKRQLARQIRKTIIHELAHLIGMTEEQIRQLKY